MVPDRRNAFPPDEVKKWNFELDLDYDLFFCLVFASSTSSVPKERLVESCLKHCFYGTPLPSCVLAEREKNKKGRERK